MKAILKLTIVTSTNGNSNSQTKHVQLGDKIELNKNVVSITLNDVKIVFNKDDA